MRVSITVLWEKKNSGCGALAKEDQRGGDRKSHLIQSKQDNQTSTRRVLIPTGSYSAKRWFNPRQVREKS
jgi:hypothetical protein